MNNNETHLIRYIRNFLEFVHNRFIVLLVPTQIIRLIFPQIFNLLQQTLIGSSDKNN